MIKIKLNKDKIIKLSIPIEEVGRSQQPLLVKGKR